MYSSLTADGDITGIRTGTGDMIVLVHGVGMAAEIWMPQILDLKNGFEVIAPNLPGHGSKFLASKTASIDDYVRWLSRLTEELDTGPIHLVGHSLGALIALEYAIANPTGVKRLALLNCVYQRSKAARRRAKATAQSINEGNFDFESTLQRWFPEREADDTAVNLCRKLLQQVHREGYALAYNAFAAGDDIATKKLATLSSKTLLLTGALDPNSTPAMSEALGDCIPQSKTTIIPAHRHMVNQTASGQVNNALRRWLQEE